MAITYDSYSSYAYTSGSSTTFDHTMTPNPNGMVIVAVCGMRTQTGNQAWQASAVTYGGESCSTLELLQADATNRDYTIHLLYLLDPPGGTQTVSVTLDYAVTDWTVSVLALHGVAQTGTFPVADQTDTSSPLSCSFTSTTAGDWILGVGMRCYGDATVSYTDLTERWKTSTGSGGEAVDITTAGATMVSTGGTVEPSFSFSDTGATLGIFVRFVAVDVRRVIAGKFEVAWDGTNYTNESSRLVRANGQTSLNAPGSPITSPRGIISQMSVELNNYDGRFSPLNSGGALYSNIQAGKSYHRKCRFSVSLDGGSSYTRLFTGVIKIPRENALTFKDAATVTIDCRGMEELILDRRVSTSATNFLGYYNNGYTEQDIIREFLTEVDIDGGDMSLDYGMWVIPWAWLDDESPIEDCWTLAAACGGYFYANHNGTFVYENAAHWYNAGSHTAHTTSLETLTKAQYQSISSYYNDRDLYKVVTVEASPRGIAGIATVWQPDDTIMVPANTTKSITARLRQPAFEVVAATFTAVTAGGLDISSDVTLDITTNAYAQRIDMSIENANATYAAYLRRFSLLGRAVTGGPTTEVQETSNDSFWTGRGSRSRAIRSNVYIQSRPQAEMLAEMIIDRHATPMLFYRIGGVPGGRADETLRRLGDRITIDDADMMSSDLDNRDAIIVGLDWTFDPNTTGYKDDLVAVDAADLFPNGIDDYFIIGTSAWNGSDNLFY